MLSPEEEQIALQEVVCWINEHCSSIPTPADERIRIAVGCFDVAIEHQAAIALLSSKKLYGPMFALLRVIMESVVRGLWLSQCASDAEISRFKKKGLDRGKTFNNLIEDIEEKVDYTQGPLSTLMKNGWSNLNDFTHTGFNHITRRYGPDSTGANYPKTEISSALALAGALGLIAASQLAELSGSHSLTQSIIERMKEYANHAATPSSRLSVSP